MSYWCWEDMSPFTNSSIQWMPFEPSDAGFCGILSEPSTRGLKAATCINPLNGSVCEKQGKYVGIMHYWKFIERETIGGIVFYNIDIFTKIFMKNRLSIDFKHMKQSITQNFKSRRKFVSGSE